MTFFAVFISNNVFNETVSGCEQDRPLNRLHVTFDGDVVLCCQDWNRNIILGNLNQNSINEIWNSEKYNFVRKSIYLRDLKSPNLCVKCKLARK